MTFFLLFVQYFVKTDTTILSHHANVFYSPRGGQSSEFGHFVAKLLYSMSIVTRSLDGIAIARFDATQAIRIPTSLMKGARARYCGPIQISFTRRAVAFVEVWCLHGVFHSHVLTDERLSVGQALLLGIHALLHHLCEDWWKPWVLMCAFSER